MEGLVKLIIEPINVFCKEVLSELQCKSKCCGDTCACSCDTKGEHDASNVSTQMSNFDDDNQSNASTATILVPPPIKK